MLKNLKKVLLAGLIGLSGSVGAAQADVTVEFWHSFDGSGGEALGEIIENFQAANPDIKIDAQFIGNYNDIVAKLQAAIPARRAPDAVIMEVTRYGLFADRGVLLDLTEKVDNDPLKDDLFDFAREVGVFEGKNYIVPFNSSTPVLYYNKEIFERAGFAEEPALKTYDDLLAVSKQITEKLGDEGITGIAAPGQFARWGLIMDNDSDLIDSKTGEILIDSPNTIEAYEWMASLVHEHKVASADGVTKENNGRDAFLAGKVGIMLNSTGNYGRSKKALGDNLAVRPMPCNKVCAVPIGGAGIGILSSADKETQDAAYKFISFAASPESNATWFSGTGYMPINKNTAKQPLAAAAVQDKPGITVAIDQLDFARGRPRPPVVTWMRATEYDMWQAMALGQRDVTETLKDFADRTRKEAERTN
ncbi:MULTISPECIES: ABC transporter substrate-binding protein [Stappiaceae]|uniref:ABC transporter substrate-binding protein n=1 Tax=Stappiaceae TaxID=2821832 RepID=UPI001446D9D2|nr:MULTISPECIES: ABC transporter substrate-binding protein [Stappiaceae]NKX68033.1 ABC transporter substrate-binding protein [Labrenzia sp. 5N]UES41677.1 extracellular solute-binding protein [Roseibium aggregatum]